MTRFLLDFFSSEVGWALLFSIALINVSVWRAASAPEVPKPYDTGAPYQLAKTVYSCSFDRGQTYKVIATAFGNTVLDPSPHCYGATHLRIENVNEVQTWELPGPFPKERAILHSDNGRSLIIENVGTGPAACSIDGNPTAEKYDFALRIGGSFIGNHEAYPKLRCIPLPEKKP